MIIGLDHIVLVVRDLTASADRFSALLGVAPAWRTQEDGASSVIFTLDNVSLELLAPGLAAPASEPIEAVLREDGEGLASLAFSVADLARTHRRLANLGLEPEPMVAGSSHDVATGQPLTWNRTRTRHTHGLRAFLIALDAPRPHSPPTVSSPIRALERVIIRTADAERAAAFYGARLGLEMRLDQKMGPGRMMFFRCGEVTLEVLATPDADPERDRLWGLTWRGDHMAALHTRLSGAGFAVSELRQGRGPGTQIFTVRDGTNGVPTAVLQPAPARS
ncbi:MAG: VOC family protein [Caulobacteraceae bacterium]